MNDADKKRGLYRKYFVQRLHPEDAVKDLRLTYDSLDLTFKVFPPPKHEDCRYYVLDLKHDRFAGLALRAYADACEAEYPKLAKDLRALLSPPATGRGGR